MFGPRITTVFRSRWRAVWFVLSVLLGVYFSVPGQDGKDDGQARAEAAAIAALIQQGQPAPPGDSGKHVNPWAKNAPK